MTYPTDNTPELAIIDRNTLASMGLRQLLETAMPFMSVKTFATFGEFEASHPDHFVHFFVSMHILLENRSFFLQGNRQRRTIVLTLGNDPHSQVQGFHCLCISIPERSLIKQLVALQQKGHPHGKHLPQMEQGSSECILSCRETEVLALIAQGKINKEIADQLCIGLTTVISHRKNIQEKLGLKTISALTIYAVMHGYVDINKI